VTAFELFGQHAQIDIADSERSQFFHRRQDVVAASTRPAMTLSRIMQLLCETEPPGILAMPPIDDITKRVHAFLRIIVEPDPAPCFQVDAGYLFAGAQIFDRCRSFYRCNSVRDAKAIAAAIEPEYQAGFLWSSTMYK